MAGSDATEGQAVWQPGGAEEDSRLREGNRHLLLAYDEEEEEENKKYENLLSKLATTCVSNSLLEYNQMARRRCLLTASLA